MKARIINTIPEKVILYRLDEFTHKITKIAQGLNITVKVLECNQAGELLGFLAGYDNFSSNYSEIQSEISCLILSGLTDNSLNKFLNKLRSQGISIPYKAIVTPSNQNWSLDELANELVKEHQLLGG